MQTGTKSDPMIDEITNMTIFYNKSKWLYIEGSLFNFSLLGACNIISVQNIHLMSRTGSPFSTLNLTRRFIEIFFVGDDILRYSNAG